MSIYRPTVASVVYKRTGSERFYAMVQKPNWDAHEWGIIQGAFEVDSDRNHKDTARREPREELGTLLFGQCINTRISVQRPFQQKTRERYPDQGYAGKEVHYFGLEFIGEESDIRLSDELSAVCFVTQEELLARIKYADELPPVLTRIEEERAGERCGSIYIPGFNLRRAQPALGR
jgi:8-oxo-dGTP pyrophosphatase MutT (NUDIX family)